MSQSPQTGRVHFYNISDGKLLIDDMSQSPQTGRVHFYVKSLNVEHFSASGLNPLKRVVCISIAGSFRVY